MITHISGRAARIVAVGTVVILISVMLTQLALAGSSFDGSTAQQGSAEQSAQTSPRPSSPSAYALYGDTVNAMGSNQTTMQTNWGLDGYASWEFYGAGTSSTGAALGGFAYNATHGIGVWGAAPKGTGVKGTSTDLNTFGVQGISDSGIGVEGRSTNGDAVKGTSTSQMGVHGMSTNGDGVRGESTNQTGALGKTVYGNGVWGITTQAAVVSMRRTSAPGEECSARATAARVLRVTDQHTGYMAGRGQPAPTVMASTATVPPTSESTAMERAGVYTAVPPRQILLQATPGSMGTPITFRASMATVVTTRACTAPRQPAMG